MWKTIFKIPKDLRSEIEVVCRDIKQKDNSFNFKISDKKLIIFSDSEKQAYARGYWFKQKVDKRLLFKVEK